MQFCWSWPPLCVPLALGWPGVLHSNGSAEARPAHREVPIVAWVVALPQQPIGALVWSFFAPCCSAILRHAYVGQLREGVVVEFVGRALAHSRRRQLSRELLVARNTAHTIRLVCCTTFTAWCYDSIHVSPARDWPNTTQICRNCIRLCTYNIMCCTCKNSWSFQRSAGRGVMSGHQL